MGQPWKRWGKSAQPSCDLHHASALSKANLINKLVAALKRINGLKSWSSCRAGLLKS